METTFSTPDIECGGCTASIKKAMGRLNGVQSVGVDLPTKTVAVLFDEALSSREQLAQALTDIGFPPEKASS